MCLASFVSSLKRENDATRRAFRLLVPCDRFRFIKHAPPSPCYGESRLFSGSAGKNRLPLLRLKKKKERKEKEKGNLYRRARVSGESRGASKEECRRDGVGSLYE